MARELGAALRTQISRSNVLKRRLHQSVFWHFEKPTFSTESADFCQSPQAATTRGWRICSGLCKATPEAEGIYEPGQLMKDRSHDEAVAELFQADPFYAAELLAEVVQDGSADELAILERQLSVAFATREINPNS